MGWRARWSFGGVVLVTRVFYRDAIWRILFRIWHHPSPPRENIIAGGAKLFSADHPSDIIPCISKECPLAHKIIPPAHRRSPSALQSPLHIRKNIKSGVSAAHKTPSPPASSSPIRFTTRIRPRHPHTHISPPTPPTRNRRLKKKHPHHRHSHAIVSLPFLRAPSACLPPSLSIPIPPDHRPQLC